MTTPQGCLFNISDRTEQILEILENHINDLDDREDAKNMCKAVATAVSEFDDRLQLLEDKMNLIIKLLTK